MSPSQCPTAVDEDVDDGRVVAVATPVRQHLDWRRPPRPPLPQLGVPGGGHDPDRDRHLVAGQAVRIPLAVPALVGVSQRLAHRLVQPDAGRQAGPDLAVSRQAALVQPGSVSARTTRPARRWAGRSSARWRTKKRIASPGWAISIGAIAALNATSSPPASTAVSGASDVQPRNRSSAT